SSYDGVLYDASRSSLLLIPGGRQGAVRISSKAEEVDASAFSHCAGVDSISVDAGSAHLSSWEGLLYDADGTTLLRVPAGATEIAIREGCTTIAAGALEACASLERINAPSTVTSISPDVFTAIPTVSLLAAAVAAGGSGASIGATEEPTEQASPARTSGSSGTQLSVLVALFSTADDFPEVDPSAIKAQMPKNADAAVWQVAGFSIVDDVEPGDYSALLSSVSTASSSGNSAIVANGGTLSSTWVNGSIVDHAIPGGYWQFDYWTVTLYDSAGNLIDTIKLEAPGGAIFLGWSTRIGADDYFMVDRHSTSESRYWYANWNVAVSWSPNGGYWGTDQTATLPAGGRFVNNAIATSFDNATLPQRNGYTFMGWSADPAASSGVMSVIIQSPGGTYYATWQANAYDILFDANGGTIYGSASWLASDPRVTFDTTYWSTVAAAVRPGYAFTGWFTSPSGGIQIYKPYAGNYSTPVNEGTYWKDDHWVYAGNTTLYAQWVAIEEAVVPLEVEARVDVLGIEDQTPATGYIESRCGEPLKVASVEITSLPGATELFGAGNESQVQLQALAGEGAAWQPGGANASFSFPLGASATESDAGKLAALTMQAYEDRVPISYRFAIPEALLSSLAEITKPVCSVAYTVALA
ncbi:MAG: hypothetical protein HFJ73_02815, partial [Eggerthellaceae bacterium]|nr:hypothetical protein [Eggerthellaceae bacterium]